MRADVYIYEPLTISIIDNDEIIADGLRRIMRRAPYTRTTFVNKDHEALSHVDETVTGVWFEGWDNLPRMNFGEITEPFEPLLTLAPQNKKV